MPRRRRLPPEPKPVIHPDLAPRFARRHELEEQIERLQSQIEDEDEAIREYVARQFNATPNDRGRVEPEDLEIPSAWVCEKGSPTGYCVYDNMNDPANDSCLYCGEPRERK